MPKKDGTGPMGLGTKTGRGLGICNEDNTKTDFAFQGIRAGRGRKCRSGFGCGFGAERYSAENKKNVLKQKKEALQNKMDLLDRQINTL